MATQKKDQRNKEIVEKRIADPKKWTWKTLGKHYGIHRSTVQKLFKREIDILGK